MLRILIRFLGLLLLAGGFIALIVDGTRSLAGGRLLVTTLDNAATDLFPAALKGLQTAVEQGLAPFVWDPLLATLMMAPVSVAFGWLGALFIVLSHKHQAHLGFMEP
jgi:hypothetical protein